MIVYVAVVRYFASVRAGSPGAEPAKGVEVLIEEWNIDGLFEPYQTVLW